MIVVHTRLLDPLSRAMKIVLGEKRAAYHAVEAPVFGADMGLLDIDALGRTPIIIDDMWGNGAIIPEALPAFEYIEDIIPNPHLFFGGPMERARVRVFCIEAINGFAPIYDAAMFERAHKILNRAGSPDTIKLRQIREMAREYAEKVGLIASKSGWLVGDKMSLADIIVWAQLSVLDYLDFISWDIIPDGKQYYLGLKQRPAFRQILNDINPALPPPPHYKILDF